MAVDYLDKEAVAGAVQARIERDTDEGDEFPGWVLDHLILIRNSKLPQVPMYEAANALALAFWLGVLAQENGWPLAR